MDSAAWERLWRELDKIRTYGRQLDIQTALAAAREANVDLSLDDLHLLIQKMPRLVHQSLPICPPAIARFVSDYLKGAKVDSILDPQADSLLLASLAVATTVADVRGYIRSHDALALANALYIGQTISWHHANFLHTSMQSSEQFDVVASCLSFGMKPMNASFSSPEGEVNVRDNEEYILLLKSCLHLKPHGVAFFVVFNGFFFCSRFKQCIQCPSTIRFVCRCCHERAQ
ncbi:MAG: hypothetical protein OJF49_002962 [Ktedonobacterales bacterium]|jgi:hypothetical protein|nr:MAG: hypothetical protein OJF49_002962 [Ktedonobacterales bacterium]